MRTKTEFSLMRELQIDFISKFVSATLLENEFRCYQKPAKINGHPFGYCGVITFKITKTKKRSKSK